MQVRPTLSARPRRKHPALTLTASKSGSVINGKFTYSIGTPNDLLEDIDDFLEQIRYDWTNVTAA